MNSQLLTRADLADLIERHSAQMVAALRVPVADVGGPPGLRITPWEKVADEEGQSYSWPAGLEFYTPFETWQTVDDRGGVQIGLGRVTEPKAFYGDKERFWWLAFEMVGSQKHRPIVVFNEADDHQKTGDLLAVIKGKGDRGRSMFAPGDELPAYYAHMPVDTFRNRISGPQAPNRLAVVVPGEDREVMLDHALIQLRLRS